MRAIIGLTLLVGGALGGLEHVTQQNPALLVPLWANAATAEGALPAATTAPQADPATPPAADKAVAQTVAIADAAQGKQQPTQQPVAQKTAQKTADVIVPPVKRVKPITPPAEPAAIAVPEVKSAATVAAGAVAVAAVAAKSAKVFSGRSTLGGPVSAVGPAAKTAPAKPAKQVTKQAVATPKPAPALQKRPGFKLTCTAAQRLDVAKQRCIAIKSNLATASAKPKA